MARPNSEAFRTFVATVEPRLRRALVATYGPVDGRLGTVDALSWAWENWGRMPSISNPVAYLYRVGQTSIRKVRPRPIPVEPSPTHADITERDPELLAALAGLSEQQRAVVVLVHAFGWSQAEVAQTLDVAPSTVHAHLSRAVTHLRTNLEVDHHVP